MSIEILKKFMINISVPSVFSAAKKNNISVFSGANTKNSSVAKG
ncbi:MAG: hypothetical protein BWY69_01241 [Planctomycetes bacterium ADurb.Bin401]|nr:MAG: hypothetical protein BWY69_01241 [Planctomycetes bacterium ADurb.Bin401]